MDNYATIQRNGYIQRSKGRGDRHGSELKKDSKNYSSREMVPCLAAQSKERVKQKRGRG
jgi:hypothetical protein